jgi:ribosomal protein S4
MTKRTSAKHKLDRRMGENIWGRPNSPVNKRQYGPGQHGQRRKGKVSDFGLQLRAKQKLKGYYGNISEKQFRKYYQEAIRMKGDSGDNMIGLLERRLDALGLGRPLRAPMSAAQVYAEVTSHQGVLWTGEEAAAIEAVVEKVAAAVVAVTT